MVLSYFFDWVFRFKENRMLKYFDYEHLPEDLQNISRPFKELVEQMMQEADVDEDEIEAGVRKLLEAKDCFVRAHIKK